MGWKEKGKLEYQDGNYEAALDSYRTAITSFANCPADERQIILSNMVACRLQIGGPTQAEAAVTTAEQVCYWFLFFQTRVQLANSSPKEWSWSKVGCKQLPAGLPPGLQTC